MAGQDLDIPVGEPGCTRWNGWTVSVRRRFITLLAERGCVTYAAAAVGKSKTGAYALRQRDPVFAAAWEVAIDIALDMIEAVLIDRVINGVKRPVWHGGKRHETIVYSDALAMFMLRRRRPLTYANVRAAETVADPGEARAELHRRLKLLQDRVSGHGGG